MRCSFSSCIFFTAIICSAPSTTFSLDCAANQVGGTVFMDYNADGRQDLGENGADGITVHAVNSGGEVVASGITDVDGVFKLTVLPELPIKIELAGLPSGVFGGPMGESVKSAIQFTKVDGDCSKRFGLYSSSEYCPASQIVTTQLVPGDSQTDGPIAGMPALVGFDYLSTGSAALNPATQLATARQLGTTWGIAYHKYSKVVFAGAMMKRHAAVGPLGLSGIYQIDLSNPAAPLVTPYVRLADYGYDFGTDPRSPGDLSSTVGAPSMDSSAFDMVGKSGFGDLELSDDQKTLFAINLKDRRLYKLAVGNPVTAISPDKISTIDIPNPGCSDGDFVPWALKYYRNALYVGVACTAETTQLPSDLKAVVLKFNGSSFASVAEFNFANYNRGTALHPLSPLFPFIYPDAGGVSRPWATSYAQMIGYSTVFTPGAFYLYAQLALSNIEFDSDRSMILAFKDRSGDQFGFFDYGPVAFPVNLELTVPQGDLVRLCAEGDSFIPESNGGCSNDGPTLGQNNNQGPGGGEFYYNDAALDPVTSSPVHNEALNGAALLIPQFGEIVATATNPLNTYGTGGVKVFSATDAGINRAYEVFGENGGGFGKSSGLGDLEALCPPAPVQIGNRVWLDTNSDGRQNAGEPGIAGVTVTIRKASDNSLVATKLTDSSGQYFFGIEDGVLPGGSYTISVGSDTDFSSGPLTGLTLTAKNSGEISEDSNGELTDGHVSAPVVVGEFGTFDHSYDFGFVSSGCRVVSTSVSSAQLDGSSASLNTLVKQARRRVKNDTRAGKCSSSQSAALLNRLVAKQEASHQLIWTNAWSFSSATLCDSTPVGCAVVDSSSTFNQINQELTVMRNRLSKILQNSCFKTKTGKRAAKVFRARGKTFHTVGVDSLREFQPISTSCEGVA